MCANLLPNKGHHFCGNEYRESLVKIYYIFNLKK